MNSQTFSQNPCKRGKSHHHVAMITSSLHFPQRPHLTEVNHVNFVIFLPMQTRHSCLKKKKRSIFTTVLDCLWSAVLCTCLKHSCPQCCLPCCCSAAAFWNLHPIPEQCAEPSAGLCHCPFACRLHTAKGRWLSQVRGVCVCVRLTVHRCVHICSQQCVYVCVCVCEREREKMWVCLWYGTLSLRITQSDGQLHTSIYECLASFQGEKSHFFTIFPDLVCLQKWPTKSLYNHTM